MKLLARTRNASLSFYEPERAHKRSLHLCRTHSSHLVKVREAINADEDFNVVPYGKWDYFIEHEADISACPECEFGEIAHYYSLYYLEVSDRDIPGVRFSFHTPYPIGVGFLPAPETMSQVMHMEQEGIFRFGRAVDADEAIVHEEAEVARQLQVAMACVEAMLVEGHLTLSSR